MFIQWQRIKSKYLNFGFLIFLFLILFKSFLLYIYLFKKFIFVLNNMKIIFKKMAKGLAMGLNKGHIVTKIEVPSWQDIKRRKIIILIYYFYSKEKVKCC